jgi:hypothetical protein
MVSFLVYFGVRCKCPVCNVVRWIVFVVVAVLCMWLSYVYCGHLMCTVVILCVCVGFLGVLWSSYVYVWASYVYCGHLMCMCGLLMCTC